MESPRHITWTEWIERIDSPSAGLCRPDLAIVILNYNGAALLADCLSSVFVSAGSFSYTVCVVDNASQDDSVAMVKDRFPEAGLIVAEKNLGFSAGNNLAFRQLGFTDSGAPAPAAAQPRYTLLLNNDTVLPPTALADMIDFMDERPGVGIAGPRVRRPDGSLDLACRRSFPTPWVSFCRMTGLSRLFPASPRFNAYNLGYQPEDAVHPVDSVVGAYLQARGEAVQQVGLLDEAYFMYGEDLDWAKRIKDAGWEVWYNGKVEITHVKRASSRKSRKARRAFYEAMWIFYRKHYQADSSWALDKLIWLGVWGVFSSQFLIFSWEFLRQFLVGSFEFLVEGRARTKN